MNDEMTDDEIRKERNQKRNIRKKLAMKKGDAYIKPKCEIKKDKAYAKYLRQRRKDSK